MSQPLNQELFSRDIYAKESEPPRLAFFISLSVPGTGLEPACLAALPPQGSKSTNFSTRASHRRV